VSPSEIEKKTSFLNDKLVTDQETLKHRNALLKEIASDNPKAILLFNIDNFKQINVQFGYEVGDAILKDVAVALENNLPSYGKLFHLAGDEFVILLNNSIPKYAVELAQQILTYISHYEFHADDIDIRISFTIGISHGVGESVIDEAIFAHQDAAMIGKNRYRLYTPGNYAEKIQKQNHIWLPKLKEAIDNDDIIPYFQPIVDNTQGKVVKFECLARLNDNGKIIDPYHFIEPARVSGQLTSITRMMIQKSFQAFSKSDISFSINITHDDLEDGYLADFLKQKCNYYNIDPNRVTIELLEDIAHHGVEDAFSQLEILNAYGHKVAIDDFGVGFSNFKRLLNMDVDFIKIDGSLIQNLHNNKRSQKIVESINNFVESIGAYTIAEFVDCQEVFDEVKRLNIHYSQGYYFGRPSPDFHTYI
jgi:diguanylate cyclase (GGDEF)-like protein